MLLNKNGMFLYWISNVLGCSVACEFVSKLRLGVSSAGKLIGGGGSEGRQEMGGYCETVKL